jgi:hypothetical protein
VRMDICRLIRLVPLTAGSALPPVRADVTSSTSVSATVRYVQVLSTALESDQAVAPALPSAARADGR